MGVLYRKSPLLWYPRQESRTISWNKPYIPPQNQHLASGLYAHKNRIYFITIRAYNNLSPFILPSLNELMLDVLREEQVRQNCTIFTYCLMPDHLHFLVSPNVDGISVLKFTDGYKGKSTNRSWTTGWRGKLWQIRHFDHIIRTEESLYAIARYILDNPVRKDFVARSEDWPWAGHMHALP